MLALFNFKKYSALLLLIAGMFVANNLAHDSSHIAEAELDGEAFSQDECDTCLLYTSPSPRDRQKSRMPSSA